MADAGPVADTAVPLLISDAEARVPDMVSEEAVWLALSDVAIMDDVAVLVEVLAGSQRVDSVKTDDDTLEAMELDEFNDTMVLATFEDVEREVLSELGGYVTALERVAVTPAEVVKLRVTEPETPYVLESLATEPTSVEVATYVSLRAASEIHDRRTIVTISRGYHGRWRLVTVRGGRGRRRVGVSIVVADECIGILRAPRVMFNFEGSGVGLDFVPLLEIIGIGGSCHACSKEWQTNYRHKDDSEKRGFHIRGSF